MKNLRTLVGVTIIVLIAGVLVAIWYAGKGGVQRASTQAPVLGTARVGQSAPEFAVATNQGYFNLAQTRKPVFLEVFATWCPHCQRETAVIDKLYAKYKDRVQFVAVTGSKIGMDRQSPESEEDTLNYAQEFHAHYPLAFDGSEQVAKQYLQGGFPTLVVIGKNKKIVYLTSGETSFPELDSAIKSALSG